MENTLEFKKNSSENLCVCVCMYVFVCVYIHAYKHSGAQL
jgi:hypothetical protein